MSARTGFSRRAGRMAAASIGVFSLLGGSAVLAGSTPAGAAGNLYVSSYGTDTANNCASSSNPCLTLTHAYSVASAGNTINLAGGTFKGGLTITKSINIVGTLSDGSLNVLTTTISHGTSLHQFILEVNGGTVNISNVVIDGQNKEGGGLDINAPGVLNLTNVDVVNNIASLYYGAGVQNDGTFTMTGGSISGNTGTKTNGFGGGFAAVGTAISSTFDGVSFNHDVTSDEGGAIYLDDGSLTFEGKNNIHNNSAGFDGGGIEKCGATTLKLALGATLSDTANTPNDFGNAC